MKIDQETLDGIVAFHGHMCPGLSMGVQAARIALREIGPHARDEEVVTVTETDMCGVDAIQYLTGCTFGKGNLIHRDWGKNAYTFYRRSDGRAIRVSGRPDAWQRDPEHEELGRKVRGRTATEEEQVRWRELHEESSYRILEIDPDELFDIEVVKEPPPSRARIHASVMCDVCAENVMETRVRMWQGEHLCPPCFAKASGER